MRDSDDREIRLDKDNERLIEAITRNKRIDESLTVWRFDQISNVNVTSRKNGMIEVLFRDRAVLHLKVKEEEYKFLLGIAKENFKQIYQIETRASRETVDLERDEIGSILSLRADHLKLRILQTCITITVVITPGILYISPFIALPCFLVMAIGVTAKYAPWTPKKIWIYEEEKARYEKISSAPIPAVRKA